MPNKTIFITILVFLIGFLALNIAYKTVLAVDGNETPNITQTPQNSPNLTAGDSVKQEAQGWMEKAQNWLTESANKAYESARKATRQEINRQIEKQIKSVENQVTTNVKSVADVMRENISKVVTKIKIFFINLKNKIFNNNTNLVPYQ